MTNMVDFKQVKEYIESLCREKNDKEIFELLSLICKKSNVFDIENQYSYATGRVCKWDQMILRELVSKGYNNIIFEDEFGEKYNYYEIGFSDEQLSAMVEVEDLYQDNDGYTVVKVKELNLEAEKEFVKKLYIPQVHCKRCNGHVLKSQSEDYDYQCLGCDEDLFECETFIVTDEEKELTDKVLNEQAIKAYELDCVCKEDN